MKFANVRSQGLRNRCEPCGCRTRSHFFMLDDGAAYNVDTGGTIWYQASDSFQWQQVYQCKHYIPWSGGVSRLDHVMRDEQGFPGNWKTCLRVPCGRPMSGSFIGFQTDSNSCVVFHNGRIVYDGGYRSDCDGQLMFSNQDACTYYGFGSSAYTNWLTTENCNNNSPPGRDTPLYRNTDGLWTIHPGTGVWTHVDQKAFVPGESTRVFSVSETFDTSDVCRENFGWGISIFGQDCCGNNVSLPYDTGMHLGTNESGSLVWFTVKKRHARWGRFAGQVTTVDELPDLIAQKDWQVVNEYGEPQLCGTVQGTVNQQSIIGDNTYWTMLWEMLWELYFPDRDASEFDWDVLWELMVRDFDGDPHLPVDTAEFWQTMQETFGITKPILRNAIEGEQEIVIPCGLTDYDVIVVGEGDYWDCDVYYLKDGQWIPHAGTYGEMVMNFPTACVIHESTAGLLTTSECIKRPDAWLGNAARVQACGDVALINGNVKELDRLLLINGKVFAREKAVKRRSDIDMYDFCVCAFSQHYYHGLPDDASVCDAADGVCFVRFTQADGSVRHIITYFDGAEWTITEAATTAPGEPVWECGFSSGSNSYQRKNSYWLAIGRTWDSGIHERKLFYKGECVSPTYIYDPANYPGVLMQSLHIPLGLVGSCGAVYPCPRQSPDDPLVTRYSVWDEHGAQTLNCSEMYHWGCVSGDVVWAVSAFEPETNQPKIDTLTNSYSYTSQSRNFYTCELQGTTVYDIEERIEYHTVYVLGLGLTLYTPGTLSKRTTITQKDKDGNVISTSTNDEGFDGPENHWTSYLSSNYNCENPTPGSGVTNPPVSPTLFGFMQILQSGCTFYSEPPKVVERVQEVDHSLSDGEESFVDVSFNTTFVTLYAVQPAPGTNASRADFASPVTTAQHLRIAQSNGKGACGPYYENGTYHYTYYNAVSGYSVPIYNRMFFAGYRYLYRGEMRSTDYGHLLIAADVDSKATGSFLVNLLIPNVYACWSMYGWKIKGDGTATMRGICLQAVLGTILNEEGESDEGVVQFITHIVNLEADVLSFGPPMNASGVMGNVRVVDYSTVEEDTSDHRQTTWYKLCKNHGNYTSFYCGTLIEHKTNDILIDGDYYENEGTDNETYVEPVYDTQEWDEVYWKGSIMYTSPLRTEGGWTFGLCCRAAHMVSITEERNGMLRHMVFIEGEQVWEVNENVSAPFTLHDCCATHNGEHRYALLGVGDLVEEIDDYGGEWFSFPGMTCENYSPYDPASWETIFQRAWDERMDHHITLTDGTKAYPIDVALDVISTLGGQCYWYCWYPWYATTDGVVFPGLKEKGIDHGGLEGDWRIIDVFVPDRVALAKKRVTDHRERRLYHNAVPIASNKRYDGLYCCGDYAICVYVDDEYLSGWKDEWFEWLGMGSTASGVRRKWTPNPGWGDASPPPAADRQAWDYYKSVYPGFKVDVFCAGECVGTFPLSDANSPIHYDHLGIGMVWLLFAAQQHVAARYDIGAIPWTLEGTPKCHRDKLLVPFDGGITTCKGEVQRRIFS